MQTTSRKRYWRCLVSGIASNAVKVGSRQFLCIRGPTGADSPGLCFNMFDSYMFLQACGNTLTEVHDGSMRPDYLIKYEHVRPWFWDWKCVTSWNYLKQHFSFGGEHSLPTSLQRSDRFVQWWITWLCNDGSHCATGKEPLVCIVRERCHHKNHHRYSQNFPNIHKLNIESVCNLIFCVTDLLDFCIAKQGRTRAASICCDSQLVQCWGYPCLHFSSLHAWLPEFTRFDLMGAAREVQEMKV